MKTVLKVTGMSCTHCVQSVTKALQNVAGVRSVSVSLEQGRAEVEHSEDLSPQSLVSAVAKTGYTADVQRTLS
ncbi:MAG: heavy-metal-associated domain-containing protein [Candidatus Bipolaricaulota bacterium]|nr:heavy-metal-associated domain-containing protein [Candidatus Bipolaricaulota bacterium]